ARTCTQDQWRSPIGAGDRFCPRGKLSAWARRARFCMHEVFGGARLCPPYGSIRAKRALSSMRRQEQILDRHDAVRNALLVQVARQSVERWPVGLDTIGPGVTAEYLVELVDVRGHPRQHVLQRTEIG